VTEKKMNLSATGSLWKQ